MIQETTTYVCSVCKSTPNVKNGTNRCGNTQSHWKNCGAYRVLKPKQTSSKTEQQTLLRACLEHCSLRAIARIFAIARQAVARWLSDYAQNLPDLKKTLLPAIPNDVLELDEIESVVQKKEQTRWVWTAMCRRTRQIVAWVRGDQSKTTWLRLWKEIPEEYKRCCTFSDFWPAYRSIFPATTHCCVGKETGETAHMERWNTTLRQRLGRYTRQTLSFSKSDEYHHFITLAFIVQYNSNLSLTT